MDQPRKEIAIAAAEIRALLQEMPVEVPPAKILEEVARRSNQVMVLKLHKIQSSDCTLT
jgi:hypothetical protein